MQAVFAYEDIETKTLKENCSREVSLSYSQLRSVVLLNCGGLIDWSAHWFVEQQINIYIFDSH